MERNYEFYDQPVKKDDLLRVRASNKLVKMMIKLVSGYFVVKCLCAELALRLEEKQMVSAVRVERNFTLMTEILHSRNFVILLLFVSLFIKMILILGTKSVM